MTRAAKILGIHFAAILGAAACATTAAKPITREGQLTFSSYATTASGASCVQSADSARKYLLSDIPYAFSGPFSERGGTATLEAFHVEIGFKLDRRGELLKVVLLSADSATAGKLVLEAFEQSSFPMLPQDAICMAGEPYKLQIENVITREHGR